MSLSEGESVFAMALVAVHVFKTANKSWNIKHKTMHDQGIIDIE